MLGFCIVSHFIALAFADQAFRRDFASLEEIFNLQIPAERESLRLKFKKEKMAQPIFRDVERSPAGLAVSDTKALSYDKYRSQFVRLGQLAGMEQPLELDVMRRGSGRNINNPCSLSPLHPDL